LIPNPSLSWQIISPSPAVFDRQTKVADYRQIPSVQEILLIDSESVFAEILRRDGERWVTEIARGPTSQLALQSLPVSVAMAELYEGVPLPEPPAAQHASG